MAQQIGGGPHMNCLLNKQVNLVTIDGKENAIVRLLTAYLSGLVLFLISLQPKPRD